MSAKKKTAPNTVSAKKATSKKNTQPATKKAVKTVDQKATSASKTPDSNEKIIAALAYFGILFFLPLVVTPDSKFGKYHANQGLLLLILGFALSVIGSIPILGWIAAFVGWIFFTVCFFIGFINAINGEKKPLPLIGDFTLIK